MLNLESILKEAGERYAQAYNLEPNLGEIRSEQVKALAAVLVDEINRELTDIDVKRKILFGGSRTGKSFPPGFMKHRYIATDAGAVRVDCMDLECPLCRDVSPSADCDADARTFGTTD